MLPSDTPIAWRWDWRDERNGGAPHVVIAGGGFAGLYAARSLRIAPVKVTIVDRRNHHLFQPLLYQVATTGLSALDIASPIRGILPLYVVKPNWTDGALI